MYFRKSSMGGYPFNERDISAKAKHTIEEVLSRTIMDGTLLCGDFRQILPVVRSGTRADIVNSCIKKSYLWQDVKILKLSTNMGVHLHNDHDAASFAKLLLEIGDGKKAIVEEPDTLLESEDAAEESALEEMCNVSGLSHQHHLIHRGLPPELPHKDLTRRRKLYARYGATSGEDPRILWPSKLELIQMMKDEKMEEVPLREKFAILQAERETAEKERLERHKLIQGNMAQMSKWIAEYKKGIQAAEDEIRARQEKKEALLDEARDYFGYNVRTNDPKFQQMIEEKEAQEKKEAREKKKKDKLKKAAERLKQDILTMGLTPGDEKTS